METEVENKKQELEDKITSIVQNNNINGCIVSFHYEPADVCGHIVLIVTDNPVHNDKFLLCQRWGMTEYEALLSAYDYINIKMPYENSYTIEWKKNGQEEKTIKSYFVGKNMFDILEKFYYKKDDNNYTIFSIKLNPIA